MLETAFADFHAPIHVIHQYNLVIDTARNVCVCIFLYIRLPNHDGCSTSMTMITVQSGMLASHHCLCWMGAGHHILHGMRHTSNAAIPLSLYYHKHWPFNIATTYLLKQSKSEGFDSCDQPSNLAQIGSKSSIFQFVWPWNLMDDLELEPNHRFFGPCQLEIWQIT